MAGHQSPKQDWPTAGPAVVPSADTSIHNVLPRCDEETLGVVQVFASVLPEGFGLPIDCDIEVTCEHSDRFGFANKDGRDIDFNETFRAIPGSKLRPGPDAVFPEVGFVSRETGIGLFDDGVGGPVIGVKLESAGDIDPGRIEIPYCCRDDAGGIFDAKGKAAIREVEVTDVSWVSAEVGNRSLGFAFATVRDLAWRRLGFRPEPRYEKPAAVSQDEDVDGVAFLRKEGDLPAGAERFVIGVRRDNQNRSRRGVVSGAR